MARLEIRQKFMSEKASYFRCFTFGQPGACSRTSSLTIFIAFTYSGAGRPGAGFILSKLKKSFDNLKIYVYLGVSTPKTGFTDPLEGITARNPPLRSLRTKLNISST